MAATLASDVTDRLVLSIINKRLRNLCKKQNWIIQIEEAISQGKLINKVQVEVLLSKPTVIAQIDELEKLRQPLAAIVSEEVDLTIYQRLWVLQNDFTSTMLSRTHERGCYLTYDFVTDDASLGGLLISRLVDSSLSHWNALQWCIEHAKLWLQNSDQLIEPNANITYAGLRERLNKIMVSDYFTTMLEMKGVVVVAAATAAGNYASFQVPVHGSISTILVLVQVEDSDLRFMHALRLNQFLLSYPSHIILILTLLYFPHMELMNVSSSDKSIQSFPQSQCDAYSAAKKNQDLICCINFCSISNRSQTFWASYYFNSYSNIIELSDIVFTVGSFHPLIYVILSSLITFNGTLRQCIIFL
ncbi:hypothetical protein UlMin_038238 [Ulmus minor]